VLPIGLAHHVKLKHDVPQGRPVRWADVEIADSDTVRFRRQMVADFATAEPLPA
jgi:predicted homoserine dehydrogenase-like protein